MLKAQESTQRAQETVEEVVGHRAYTTLAQRRAAPLPEQREVWVRSGHARIPRSLQHQATTDPQLRLLLMLWALANEAGERYLTGQALAQIYGMKGKRSRQKIYEIVAELQRLQPDLVEVEQMGDGHPARYTVFIPDDAHYIRLDRGICCDPSIPTIQKRILLVVESFRNTKSGQSFPGLATLAKAVSSPHHPVSPPSLHKQLIAMEHGCLLCRDEKGNLVVTPGKNLYRYSPGRLTDAMPPVRRSGVNPKVNLAESWVEAN